MVRSALWNANQHNPGPAKTKLLRNCKTISRERTYFSTWNRKGKALQRSRRTFRAGGGRRSKPRVHFRTCVEIESKANSQFPNHFASFDLMVDLMAGTAAALLHAGGFHQQSIEGNGSAIWRELIYCCGQIPCGQIIAIIMGESNYTHVRGRSPSLPVWASRRCLFRGIMWNFGTLRQCCDRLIVVIMMVYAKLIYRKQMKINRLWLKYGKHQIIPI